METREPLVIQTELSKVFLRQLTLADAFPLFELIKRNHDHLRRWSEETIRKYPDLASVERSFHSPPNPSKLRFGIWEERRLAGTVNLMPRDREAEVGYWLGKEFCGRGIGTCSVEAFILYAFKCLEYDRIFAIVQRGNGKSQILLLRTGFSLHDENERGLRFVRHRPPAGLLRAG